MLLLVRVWLLHWSIIHVGMVLLPVFDGMYVYRPIRQRGSLGSGFWGRNFRCCPMRDRVRLVCIRPRLFQVHHCRPRVQRGIWTRDRRWIV